MFGSQTLDVAMGVMFVYLVLALVVTAANEALAAGYRRRSWMLWHGVKNLLQDDQLAAQLYAHPLIHALRQTTRGPSYIPSRTFAVALLDLVIPLTDGRREIPAEGFPGPLGHTLTLLFEEAEGDKEKFKKNVEEWFNDSMERVSGWYKRRTQAFSLVLAVIVTVAANADTFDIARALWRDPALRQAVLTKAEKYVAEQAPAEASANPVPEPPPVPPDQQSVDADVDQTQAKLDAAIEDLRGLQLPIGWATPSPATLTNAEAPYRIVNDNERDRWPGAVWPFNGNDEWPRWFQATRAHLFGWLLTIFAVSLGAPFWFDVLNKFMSVRSAGKAPEEAQKSPKEVPKPKAPGDIR